MLDNNAAMQRSYACVAHAAGPSLMKDIVRPFTTNLSEY
jgi:hypothetical protein